MKTAHITTTSGHKWSTSINGTDEEIKAYFSGSKFNVATFPDEKMELAVKVEIEAAPFSPATFTRKQRLADECTHREYYAQFIDKGMKELVVRTFGDKLQNSQDEHFNDINLDSWDALLPFTTRKARAMKDAGDWLTMAGSVCMLKEAARQVVEGRV